MRRVRVRARLRVDVITENEVYIQLGKYKCSEASPKSRGYRSHCNPYLATLL